MEFTSELFCHIQTGAITAVITLIFGFIFVEEIVTKVIELLGMIIDIPTARGTRHLTKEEQSADVEKLHSELVDGMLFFYCRQSP